MKDIGYSNFLTHVQASHGEALAEFFRTDRSTEFSSSSRKSNLGKNLFFYKTVQFRGIIDFIVPGLLPFSIVSNSKEIRHLKYDRIDVKTLKKYLKLVTEIVERKIAKSFPNQIAVAFDGWSAGSDHYVSVFAIYESESQKGFYTVLLASSTFEAGESQSPESHIDFQRKDITLHETRVLFNSTIEEYPETRDRLAPDSSLVLNSDFANAIVKIQSRRMSELTLNESKAVKCLKQASHVDSSNAESVQSDGLSFAVRALKRAMMELNENGGYKNLKF